MLFVSFSLFFRQNIGVVCVILVGWNWNERRVSAWLVKLKIIGCLKYRSKK